MYTELKNLIGKKVKQIFMNSDLLRFVTDKGNLTYRVEGDCCSHSYFYDFYGVKNLLENGEITEIKEVELSPERKIPKPNNDSLSFYGYQIMTINKQFGEVTSTFSFRNDSNGYYGGSIKEIEDEEVSPEILNDVLEIKE